MTVSPGSISFSTATICGTESAISLRQTSGPSSPGFADKLTLKWPGLSIAGQGFSGFGSTSATVTLRGPSCPASGVHYTSGSILNGRQQTSIRIFGSAHPGLPLAPLLLNDTVAMELSDPMYVPSVRIQNARADPRRVARLLHPLSPQPAAHRVTRQPRPPCDLAHRAALAEMHPPDLRQHRHGNHS